MQRPSAANARLAPAYPNLFIVGPPKAGTTALARYLSEHPDVFLSTPKEPGYWASDLPDDIRLKYGIRGWEDYAGLFERATEAGVKYAGEATTCYLMSEVALQRIVSFNPRARFITLLRNPVELANAFHMQVLFSRQEVVEDFERAWRLQEDRARGRHIPDTCRVPPFLQYAQVAAIGSQLERALRVAPRSQLFIGFQEDLHSDPSRLYRDILQWLGLPDDGRHAFPKVNVASRQRFPVLANLLHAPPPWLAPVVRAARAAARSRRIGGLNLVSRLIDPRGATPGSAAVVPG